MISVMCLIIHELLLEHELRPGKLVAVPANEAKVVVIKEHAEEDEHGEKPEKDDAEKLDSEEVEDK